MKGYLLCDECRRPLQPTLWATGLVYYCTECDRHLVNPEAPKAILVEQ